MFDVFVTSNTNYNIYLYVYSFYNIHINNIYNY